ncbi:MAG: hypothetical protein KDA32_09660 [Phycisphaerales bacterium]|nr:hypothetical protein [Phycisphaerales bacterium]
MRLRLTMRPWALASMLVVTAAPLGCLPDLDTDIPAGRPTDTLTGMPIDNPIDKPTAAGPAKPFYERLVDCPRPDAPSKETLIQRLTALRDEARNKVRGDFRAQVEDYVAGYPVAGNADQALIYTLAATDSNAPGWQVEPTRRDWAFSVCAWMFTLAAQDAKDGPAAFETAYWCALEAALLHPEEIDHLVNLMFFLNERGALETARDVAGFALAQSPEHPAVLNNLSFCYAGMEDYGCAAGVLMDACMRNGGPDAAARERLSELFTLGGFEQAGEAWTGGGAEVSPPQRVLQSQGWANLQIAAGQAVDLAKMTADLMAALDSATGEPAERASFEWPGGYPTNIALGERTEQLNDCLFSGGSSQCACEIPYYEFVAQWDQGKLAGYVRRWQAHARGVTRIHRDALDKRLKAIAKVAGATDEEKSIAAMMWMLRANDAIAEEADIANDAIVSGINSTKDNWTFLADLEAGCAGAQLDGVPGDGVATPFTPWSLFFGIGSVSMNREGTLQFTLGQGAQAHFEYNIPTGQPGFGVGVGVAGGALLPGSPKLFSASAYVMVRPGLNAEAAVKITADPRLGVVGESVTLFNPKVVFLENAAPSAVSTRASP